MNGESENSNREKPFDLEERTAQFGEAVIAYARTIPVDEMTRPIIGQMVRAATSVGANYIHSLFWFEDSGLL
jgi:hypothetical protein